MKTMLVLVGALFLLLSVTFLNVSYNNALKQEYSKTDNPYLSTSEKLAGSTLLINEDGKSVYVRGVEVIGVYG